MLLTYSGLAVEHPAIISGIKTAPSTSLPFNKNQLKSNNRSKICNQIIINHYGICSLYLSPFATCFLPSVLKDCSPGPAGSFRRGTNADCHVPTTGCSQLLRHPRNTDSTTGIQSKVLLVLYDVSGFFRLTQILMTKSSC